MSLYQLDDLHIEDFNKDVARSLVFLYNYFPRKVEVYIEDISGPDEVDEYGLHSARHLACMSAVIWLAEEGFIRYETLVKQESFDQAVLTKKSYTLLCNFIEKELSDDEELNLPVSVLPTSVLRSRHTRIAALKSALKAKSSEKLKAEVSNFILASE